MTTTAAAKPELRPMKVVRDHYDNPAVVTSADDDFWIGITQLAGSDFGHKTTIRRSVVEQQITERPCSPAEIEWAKGRWANLQAGVR